MDLRAAQYDDWASPCENAAQTFSTCVRHDPYCLIDPACKSPFYKPTWTRAGTTPQFMPHWQGLAWLGESGTYGTGLSMLAIPNYILFMVLLCAAVGVIEWRVYRLLPRRLLLTALTTWLVMEVLRWFAVISSSDPTVSFFNWELLGVLALSLSVLLGATTVCSRLERMHALDRNKS
jgi:apolipoprotein N-acyltransferase